MARWLLITALLVFALNVAYEFGRYSGDIQRYRAGFLAGVIAGVSANMNREPISS